MKIDRKMIDKLLELDDAQLTALVGRLTREFGVDLSALNLSADNIAELRRALANADDRMLEEAERQFNQRRRGGNG